MNCPICKIDITEPSKQFGDIRNPFCQSCYADYYWVQDVPDILDSLSRGATIKEAEKLFAQNILDEMAADMREFLTDGLV
jgi:hypothetical protein